MLSLLNTGKLHMYIEVGEVPVSLLKLKILALECVIQ